MFELGNQIDKTLNMALCIKDQIATQHVFKIESIFTKYFHKLNVNIVKSYWWVFDKNRSMYGYHDKDSLFLKIYLYNPDLIKKYQC